MIPTLNLALIERLHQDSEFILWRARREDGSAALALIPLAEQPATSSLQQLDREYALREDCAACGALAPKTIKRPPGFSCLIYDDPGGVLLDQLCASANKFSKINLDDFLTLALNISKALNCLHRRGLIHKNIKPTNILIGEDRTTVHLTGFGYTERINRNQQEPEIREEITGSFAYMAPEQTGRMNRSVDTRSDLYSLGIVLYQLLTGTLPFTANDPLGWFHCHIAQLPQAPIERRPDTPPVLSTLIMKLLAKENEKRYQTASGLATDLKRCREEWKNNGYISNFALGSSDCSEQFLLPEKLYGRDAEIACLSAAFERVSGGGTKELILVSGYSGIGKSALVYELRKTVVMPRGLFGSGKFDQFKRNIPYAILAEVFIAFVRQMLTSSDYDLATWRKKVLDAVGANGQLLIDLIPDLERVIGPQPAVGALGPQETQNRLFSVFTQFIGVFATAEHPLVLFLDDLQWLDHGSLKLMEHLATQRELDYLLLIGGYRDNEVGPSHPLMLTLDSIKKQGIPSQNIVLTPLDATDLTHLLADTLHCPALETTFLAALILEKTGGNPFFSLQFLSALHEEGLLTFDKASSKWVWDAAKIRAKAYTDNVVDLMLSKLQRLPALAQRSMMTCACLGTTVSQQTLATATGQSIEDLGQNLAEPLRAGYLVRHEQNFKFSHDRIQEAAYLLLPEGARQKEHLRIGRLLFAASAPNKIEEDVFNLVRQYNAGSPLVLSLEEKALLCRLNVLAGRRSKSSGAHASAQFYFACAQAQLPKDAWQADYQNTFAIHMDLAESEFLTSHFDRADTLFNTILQQANSDLDRAQVYRLRILLYQVAGRYDNAVATALEALRMFALTCPDNAENIEAEVEASRNEVLGLLRSRQISDLLNAPSASDPSKRAILGILANAMPSAYFASPPLYPWLILKALTLTLKEGNAEESCAAYMGYAILLASIYHDIDKAFAFSELALGLQEKLNKPLLRGRLLCRHGLFINSHRHPLSTSIATLEEAFLLCLEAGDLAYAAYSALDIAWLTMEAGGPLERVRAVIKKYLAFAEQSQNEGLRHTLLAQEHYVGALMAEPGKTDFEEDSSDSDLDALTKSNFGAGIAYFFLLKQMSAFSAGHYENALSWGTKIAAVLPSIKGWVAEVSYHYFNALSLLAVFDKTPTARQEDYRKRITDHLHELEFQSSHCPVNFSHRHRLVLAELARIENRDAEAMHLYETAIRSARSGGYLLAEAQANELAAAFFTQRNSTKASRTYLADARDGYFRWGALRKVDTLNRLHPYLNFADNEAGSHHTGIYAGKFDAMAMLKAYQAISGEIVLERLLRTLMELLMETAGAQRASLLLMRKNKLQTVAEASSGAVNNTVRLLGKNDLAQDLPSGVINYVFRTRERVLLADAKTDNVFAEDPYIQSHNAQSILCLPILKQGGFVGIFYFENNLLSGAFTERHVATLELLGLQAAASIENASLYAELEQRVEERTEALRNEISERQNAQTQLRQALTELELILEHASLGISIIVRDDGTRRILRVNRAFESILGYEHGELNGVDTRVIHVDEKEYQRFIPIYREVLQAGLSYQSEQPFRRKDNRIIFTHLVGIAIDPQNLEKGSIWLIEDITERRHAQQELETANNDLSSTLAQLKQTQNELLRTEKLAALGALVAGIAHELNTPIGNALMAVSALHDHAEDLSNMLDSPIRRSVLQSFLGVLGEGTDLAERNLERAAELVSSFKQVAVDQTSSQRRAFALAEIVSEVITILTPSFKKTPYCITSEIDPEIHMDSFPGPLGQVISNLITNAIVHAYTGLPEGTVKLTARQLDNNVIELQIIDHGHGIPESDQGRVFDPFFTTRLGQGGSGLGLSIVHNIVTDVLGGKINLASAAGQGTTFTLQLPNTAPVLHE